VAKVTASAIASMPSETAVVVLPGALPRGEVDMLQRFDHKVRIDGRDGVSHRLGGLCASIKSRGASQTDLSDPSATLTEVQQNENLTPIRKKVQSSFMEVWNLLSHYCFSFSGLWQPPRLTSMGVQG
jgi:hypothetical protein